MEGEPVVKPSRARKTSCSPPARRPRRADHDVAAMSRWWRCTSSGVDGEPRRRQVRSAGRKSRRRPRRRGDAAARDPYRPPPERRRPRRAKRWRRRPRRPAERTGSPPRVTRPGPPRGRHGRDRRPPRLLDVAQAEVRQRPRHRGEGRRQPVADRGLSGWSTSRLSRVRRARGHRPRAEISRHVSTTTPKTGQAVAAHERPAAAEAVGDAAALEHDHGRDHQPPRQQHQAGDDQSARPARIPMRRQQRRRRSGPPAARPRGRRVSAIPRSRRPSRTSSTAVTRAPARGRSRPGSGCSRRGPRASRSAPAPPRPPPAARR